MNTKYYKNYKEVIGNGKWKGTIYVGFLKKNNPIQKIASMIISKKVENFFHVTENMIIVQVDIEDNSSSSKKEAKKTMSFLRRQGGILFGVMSYKDYFVTKTAKEIIKKYNLVEKDMANTFCCVHENTLQIEKPIYHVISTQLENYNNIKIEDMEKERSSQIENRIKEIVEK